MIADGLFERFPCDEIYGLHNSPDGPRGKVTIKAGAAMAGRTSSTFASRAGARTAPTPTRPPIRS